MSARCPHCAAAIRRQTPSEYGPHWEGYGKRYGIRLTGIATGNAMEAGVAHHFGRGGQLGGIIGDHEGQEAYSQTGTSCPLPDLRRGAGR